MNYAIGDIQGCFAPLQRLLKKIQFDENKDILWFTGDLVNRGPQSLEVLRFVKALGDKHKIVLGNHDLHLIAVADGGKPRSHDTLNPILNAQDRDELMDWLRHRPLLYEESPYVLTHAGLAPSWDLPKSQSLAKEVETVLQSDSPSAFLKVMYGNLPDYWDDHLTGVDRLRCIVNYLTRMRFCFPDGRLELSYKGQIKNKPEHIIPWFEVPHRVNKDLKIIFGHWAALDGKTDVPNVFPLDTGCVWGNKLTAMRLEDEQRFCVKC
jgi:bis(5'-nucleosyl)-tetraphosphatase (symmetrical)